MNERKFAIAFFIAMLVVGAGIAAWALFLNKGTLAVVAEAPFTLRIEGKTVACDIASAGRPRSGPERAASEQSPPKSGGVVSERALLSECRVSLKPGAYTVHAEKEGYYPQETEADIAWRDTTEVAIHFSFVPVVREVESIPPLPAKPQPPVLRLSFRLIPENNVYGLYIDRGDSEELITQFKKAVRAPTFFPSLNGEKVIMREEALAAGAKRERAASEQAPPKSGGVVSERALLTEDGRERANFTLIDVGKKSRVHIDIPDAQVRWLHDEWIAWETNEEGVPQTMLRSVVDGTEHAVPTSLGAIMALGKADVVYLAEVIEIERTVSFRDLIGEEGGVIDALQPAETKTMLQLRQLRLAAGADEASAEDGSDILATLQADFSENGGEAELNSGAGDLILFGLSEDGAKLFFSRNKKLFEVLLRPE